MIYLASDPHGDPNFSCIAEYFEKAGRDDLLILLGDVCLNFEDTEENRAFTEHILSADKNIAIIDGNHENFAYLKSFPKEEWCGGTVRRLAPRVVYLERGNIYNIFGKSFFVFGGCKSSAKWRENGLWYPGEEPTDEELAFAKDNLERHGFRVDFILTHKYQKGRDSVVCEGLLDLCTFIDERVEFGKWYVGHEHRKKDIDEKHTIIYDELNVIE